MLRKIFNSIKDKSKKILINNNNDLVKKYNNEL